MTVLLLYRWNRGPESVQGYTALSGWAGTGMLTSWTAVLLPSVFLPCLPFPGPSIMPALTLNSHSHTAPFILLLWSFESSWRILWPFQPKYGVHPWSFHSNGLPIIMCYSASVVWKLTHPSDRAPGGLGACLVHLRILWHSVLSTGVVFFNERSILMFRTDTGLAYNYESDI